MRLAISIFHSPARAACIATLACAIVAITQLSAQSLTISTDSGAVRVQAPGFHFIEGESLAKLRDGQSVRFDLGVSVTPRPGAPTAVERRQTCVLSYDLWEERFAAAVAGVPSRAISHLTSAAAETWCVQQLSMPLSELGRLASDGFWVRLDCRVVNGAGATEPEDEGLTLRGLIEVFSRRRQNAEVSRSAEGGPFRVRP
jgi:hypothetical protein